MALHEVLVRVQLDYTPFIHVLIDADDMAAAIRKVDDSSGDDEITQVVSQAVDGIDIDVTDFCSVKVQSSGQGNNG